MQTKGIAQLLPTVYRDKKVDVLLENDEAVLKFSTWNEDLGWCCQKTIRLEAEMLDDLQRAIAVARHRFNNYKTGETASDNVINFPLPA